MASKSSEAKTLNDTDLDSTTAPALVAEALEGPVTPATVAGLAAGLARRSSATLDATDDTEKGEEEGGEEAEEKDERAPVKADITDELAKGGPAFGTFLRSIGMAVADTQAALDKTMGETAKMLSSNTVKIAAAYQQVLNDEGELDADTDESGAIMTEMPLIAIIPVTGYQITSLHLTADMDVSEFNTTNGFNIKKDHVGFDLNAKADYGIFKAGFSGSADTHLKTTFDNDSERRFTTEDKAAGKLHMEATIEPRHDIQLPKPYLVQKGPKLRLSVDERVDITDPTDEKKIVGRTVTLTAHLMKQDGGNLADRVIDVTCDGGFICIAERGGKTGTDGTVKITVERSGLTPEHNTPVTTNVRAAMKLVTATAAITI